MDNVDGFLRACEEGDLEKIKELLEAGTDVDVATGDGNTGLAISCANGFEHVVKHLVACGAALDSSNIYGWTPLLHSSRHGHLNCVKLLLNNRADIHTRTRLGVNAMFLAARGGHVTVLKLLHEWGADPLPATALGVGGSACEYSPLQAAALHGQDTALRYLLDRTGDWDYRTPSSGVSALMLAAVNGHMTTAQILVERGSDPNFTNVNGHTALEIANLRDKREIKGYLDRKTTNKPKQALSPPKVDIIHAARNGDLNRIREILDNDVTQRDVTSPEDGATPLMFAAMMGRLDIVMLLVESGCDMDKQDTTSGWTALMQAVFHGKKAVAKYLINHDSDVKIAAQNGCTAFDLATLIDDVDADLYNLLASRTVNRDDSAKMSFLSAKQNKNLGVSMPTGLERAGKAPQKGLRAWWSRLSSRFRNLKVSRTLGMGGSSRLAPIGDGSTDTSGTSLLNTDTTVSSHLPQSKSTDNMRNGGKTISMTNFETLLQETKKSASLFALQSPVHRSIASSASHTSGDVTLQAPFAAPPAWDSGRLKMPPRSHKKAIGSLGSTPSLASTSSRLSQQPVQLLKNYTSTQSLAHRASYTRPDDSSPSSSGGASGVSADAHSRVSRSSASSSTLTAGSDRPAGPQPSKLLPVAAASFVMSSERSRDAHYTKLRAYGSAPRAKSDSSHTTGSTASTLTPSPSPVPMVTKVEVKSSQESAKDKSSSSSDDDELGGILNRLSLEKYKPIFEEQEVDMEAFLTLSDGDLTELGITQAGSRRQILSAISELQSNKGRERQQLQETMTSFQNMMSARSKSSQSSTGLGNGDVMSNAVAPLDL